MRPIPRIEKIGSFAKTGFRGYLAIYSKANQPIVCSNEVQLAHAINRCGIYLSVESCAFDLPELILAECRQCENREERKQWNKLYRC
jgi:hypothetical protein